MSSGMRSRMSSTMSSGLALVARSRVIWRKLALSCCDRLSACCPPKTQGNLTALLTICGARYGKAGAGSPLWDCFRLSRSRSALRDWKKFGQSPERNPAVRL
jgi:hypothetical protein